MATVCRRCAGVTTRGWLCGICHAVRYGMTDVQIERALEILEPVLPKVKRRRGRPSVWDS